MMIGDRINLKEGLKGKGVKSIKKDRQKRKRIEEKGKRKERQTGSERHTKEGVREVNRERKESEQRQ